MEQDEHPLPTVQHDNCTLHTDPSSLYHKLLYAYTDANMLTGAHADKLTIQLQVQ